MDGSLNSIYLPTGEEIRSFSVSNESIGKIGGDFYFIHCFCVPVRISTMICMVPQL